MKKYSIYLFFFVLLNSIIIAQPIDTTSGWIKIASGLNFPEGPAFDGKSSIYFSNCYGAWITKYSSSSVDTFITKNDNPLSIEKTNGLAFGKDNKLYVCEYGKGLILSIDQNKNIEVYSDGFEGKQFNRPNDLVFDKSGNLFFTDPKSYDANVLDGRIFMIDAKSKKTSLVADNLAFPNGINISPANGRMYVCESAKQQIVSFRISSDLTLTDKKEFILLPGGDPDGIEFDTEGNLYVAHFGGKAVYVYSKDGKMLQKVETPGKKPTNLEFIGDDLKTLLLTEVETNSAYIISTKFSGYSKF